MKLKDILHEATAIFRAHLKGSLALIILMGLLFSLIFTVNLGLQGFNNTFTSSAGRMTDGKVLLWVSWSPNFVASGSANGPDISREEVIRDLEAYGGKLIQNPILYGRYSSPVVPQDLVAANIEVDINSAPADAAPTLVSEFLADDLIDDREKIRSIHIAENVSQKLERYQNLREELIGKTFTDSKGAKYYIVGFSDDAWVYKLSFDSFDYGNKSPLNDTFLSVFSFGSEHAFVIDNGHSGDWDRGETEDTSNSQSSHWALAVFDDVRSAYRYCQKSGASILPSPLGPDYRASSAAGMSVEDYETFSIFKTAALIGSLILTVISGVVMIFISRRLVKRDQDNIARLYGLEATKRDIEAIYFCYFAELVLGVVILGFVLAAVILLLFSGFNQKLLSAQMQLAFSLPEAPHVIWWGVNLSTFVIILAMFAVSGACVLVSGKKFDSPASQK